MTKHLTTQTERLVAVTHTASAQIQKLEADVRWYQNALEQKSQWADHETKRADHEAQRVVRLCFALAVIGVTTLSYLTWLWLR